PCTSTPPQTSVSRAPATKRSLGTTTASTSKQKIASPVIHHGRRGIDMPPPMPSDANERQTAASPGQRRMRMQGRPSLRRDDAALDRPRDRPAHGLARVPPGVAELTRGLARVVVGPRTAELVDLCAVDHRPGPRELAAELEQRRDRPKDRDRQLDAR